MIVGSFPYTQILNSPSFSPLSADELASYFLLPTSMGEKTQSEVNFGKFSWLPAFVFVCTAFSLSLFLILQALEKADPFSDLLDLTQWPVIPDLTFSPK